MRKVFEHPAFHEVGHCESILNSHGIATTIENQNVSSLAGEIPFAATYPELWVLEDEHYDRALALLREYRENVAQAAFAPEWACPKCAETVPGSFQACRNCGATKPADPSVTNANEISGLAEGS